MIRDGRDELAEAYRIFAELFSEVPEEEVIKSFKEDFSLESNDSFTDISADFQRMFAYPGGSLLPVESLYRSVTGEKPAAEADEFYADAGLILDGTSVFPPDHLALEFLFMSFLIEQNYARLEKKFLEEHILNWVPYYCEEVTVVAKTFFYREIAGLLKDFLDSEYERAIS